MFERNWKLLWLRRRGKAGEILGLVVGSGRGLELIAKRKIAFVW